MIIRVAIEPAMSANTTNNPREVDLTTMRQYAITRRLNPLASESITGTRACCSKLLTSLINRDASAGITVTETTTDTMTDALIATAISLKS